MPLVPFRLNSVGIGEAGLIGRRAAGGTGVAADSEATLQTSTPQTLPNPPNSAYQPYPRSHRIKTSVRLLNRQPHHSATNWASLTRFMVPTGTKVLAHCPLSSFVEALPVDLAVIFQAAPGGPICINHNLRTRKMLFRWRASTSRRWRALVVPLDASVPWFKRYAELLAYWTAVVTAGLSAGVVGGWACACYLGPI